MNLATGEKKAPRKLLSMNFRNNVTNSILVASFYEPQRERRYIKDARSWIIVWNTRARIIIDDVVVRDNTLPGASWLTSFMQAIESMRRLIPFEEEDAWVDESGLPSWLLIPKTIDVSWGYEFHQKLASQVASETDRFVESIHQRRIRRPP